MITIRELRFGCALLSAFLLPMAALAEGEKEKVESGSTKEIKLGEHWAGPVLKGPESLRGKVVLLMIWGGSPGCRGITPGMVGLARAHGDEPLQVIASYCQNGRKETALKLLKTKGWTEEVQNLTVMFRTEYEADFKIAFAPYYLIFDHTGKLRHHHLAGSTNGGNGEEYKQLVLRPD